MSVQLPENIYEFIYSINAESVAARYPDDIQQALNNIQKKNL
jgi:hypothetical protein